MPARATWRRRAIERASTAGARGESHRPRAARSLLLGALLTLAAAPIAATTRVGDPIRVDATTGVDCTGGSDSTTGVNRALIAATGKTLLIPSGCVLRLASPGAGNAAISVPSNTRILCEDGSAGFAAVRQRCVGGTYPAAACASSAECLGGGTCAFDFGSTKFAPTSGSTYTMLKDAGVLSQGISLENCSFWTYQADGYQRCVGGTNAADPCRQECTGGPVPGTRCEADADCVGGTCQRVADCHSSGGTCTGAPQSAVGAGRINPLDLGRTTNVRLTNVTVYDHFAGDFSIKTSGQASVLDVNAAQEISDCRSPLSSPSDSLCFAVSANQCCYGALGNPYASSQKANTQPTNAVTNGMAVGGSSKVLRAFARGTTAAISTGANCVIDGSAAWPAGSLGPGDQSCGFVLGGGSILDKSRALQLGTSCTGVDVSGGSTIVSNSQIGSGISGNQIGINIKSSNNLIQGNQITFPVTEQLPSAHQIHVLFAAGSQERIIGNLFTGGWRGITMGSRGVGALTNTQIDTNRFVSIGGAALALGGAGVFAGSNYINQSGSAHRTLYCDTTCTGGNGRGAQCLSDADCSACNGAVQKCLPEPVVFVGSPGASPAGGAITAHNNYAKNIFFRSGNQPIKQCATAPAGQLCETAGNGCAGSATCTGTPAVCQGGSEAGKYCCTSGDCSVRTDSAIMRLTDYGSASNHTNLIIGGENIFFSGGSGLTNLRAIDMLSSASLGNIDVERSQIVANTFDLFGAANTTGIMFPTSGKFSDLSITGNNFTNESADVTNYKGTYGALSFVPETVAMAADQSTTSTSNADVTALKLPVLANRSYSFRCDLIYQSAAATTGIGLAVTVPSSPTAIVYSVWQCDGSRPCTTLGTDNMDSTVCNTSDCTATSKGVTAAGTNYVAKIEGTLSNGANAGNLMARFRSEVNASQITLKAGSSCIVYQTPAGS